MRLWFNSTSPTEEFIYLGLSDLSLLNTEQVLGLIQYHISCMSQFFAKPLPVFQLLWNLTGISAALFDFFLKSGTSISTSNHLGLRLSDIFQHDLSWDIKTGFRQQHTKLKWSHGSNLLLQHQNHVSTIHNSYWNFGRVNLPFGQVNFISHLSEGRVLKKL